VDVKLCDKQINLKKIVNKRINLSSVTDAYLPYEAKYKITRKILEQLVNANCEISILTKSKLVTRDIDLFKQMKNIQVCFSINTTNEQFKNDMDKASSIKQRFDALKELHRNNIHNAIFISPLFPEITDWKNIILKSKSFVDEF
jgi:DNA repair photolyase